MIWTSLLGLVFVVVVDAVIPAVGSELVIRSFIPEED